MKKIVCLFLALSMAFCLAACQSTPEKAAVAGKTGELQKMILEPAVPDNPMLEALPDAWKEETEFKSGVSLSIDAKVEIPDAKTYPVIEVSPHTTTLDEAKAYVDILMQGQPVYEISPVRIKSDWEPEIVQVKAEIERTKNDNSLTEDMREQFLDGLNQELEFLEEQYNNAPEKKPERIPASMTFQRETDTLQVLGVEADLGQPSSAILTVNVYDDNLSNTVMFYNGGKERYFMDIYADEYAGMALTKQEAQTKAEDFLKNLGVTDMQLAYTEVWADADNNLDEDPSVLAQDPEIKKCYVFYYCPVVSGIPVTANRYYYGLSNNSEDYDMTWKAQTIMLYVNDSDIYRMDWYSPEDLGQVLNENIALMDFEEVKDRFANQMFYQRSWVMPGTEDTAITIEKVKLGMMRVRLQENEYVYLPVWDFIGDWTYVSDGVECGMYDVSFVTINAVDGSVKNRELGY